MLKKKKEIIPTSFWGKTETLQSNIVESEMCQSGKILWKWHSPCTTFWLPVSTTTVMRLTVGKPKEETSAGNSRGKCRRLHLSLRRRPFPAATSRWYLTPVCSPARPNIHTSTNTADAHFRIDVAFFFFFFCAHTNTQTTETHFPTNLKIIVTQCSFAETENFFIQIY